MKGRFGLLGLAWLVLGAQAGDTNKSLELSTTDGKRVLRFPEKPEELIERDVVLSSGHKCTRSTFRLLPAQGAVLHAFVLDCPTYDLRPEYLVQHDLLEGFVVDVSPTETGPVTHTDLEANGYKVREFRLVAGRGEIRARSYVFEHSALALMGVWKSDEPAAARDAAAFLDPF